MNERISRRIPILPVLNGILDFGRLPANVANVLDAGSCLWFRSGSMAIQAALQRAGVGPGGEVLMPAFQCPSMLEPVLQVGATPRFYELSPQLEVGIGAVSAHLNSRTRAVLAPHLFGRLQRLDDLRHMCNERQVVLIEDCAHAFFGDIDGHPVGSSGDFAIASPRKFFPLHEGGVLVAPGAGKLSGIGRGGSAGSIRTLYDTIDTSVQYGRLDALSLPIRLVKKLVGRAAPKAVVEATAQRMGNEQTLPRIVAAESWITRWMVKASNARHLIDKRLENYARLAVAIRANPLLELLEILDTRAVPYMLPVILSDPQRQFAEFKRQGLPMWRWEHSIAGKCAVADHYMKALVQIPCHQSLTSAELHTMADILSG